MLASDELVAVADAINFKYDDGRTTLNWAVGNSVNPLIWIALFLVLAIIINMAPVKVCVALKTAANNYLLGLANMRVLVVRRNRVRAWLIEADLHYHAHSHDGHSGHYESYVDSRSLLKLRNTNSVPGNSEVKCVL